MFGSIPGVRVTVSGGSIARGTGGGRVVPLKPGEMFPPVWRRLLIRSGERHTLEDVESYDSVTFEENSDLRFIGDSGIEFRDR